MVLSFFAVPLAGEQISVVFPLVQAAMPDVDLPRWRHFVQPFVENPLLPSGGAMTLWNEAGYICGLLIYRADRDLRYGDVLAVDLFMALDLVRDESATHALIAIAEAKAREFGCGTIQIRLDTAQSSLSRRFERAGHRVGAMIFWKKLGPVPPRS